MKIIQNKWINKIIPFPSFRACNLLGFVFVRGERPLSDVTINHESIHSAQMKEILYIFFYLWYFIEWLVRLIQYRNFNKAYRNISFEREAYKNENYSGYLEERKRFAFIDYLWNCI